MSKLTLQDITSGYASVAKYNANNSATEDAVENTLSRDGTAPNQMEAALDMNSNLIINLGAPVNANDAARLADVTAAISGLPTAAMVTITDADGHYTGANVEAALDEVGDNINTIETQAWFDGRLALSDPFERTAREIAKSVTPVNFLYPEGHILRYGTNTTPGTTDMSAAFTAAISLRIPIFVPHGLYRHNGQMSPIVEGGLIGQQVNTSQADGDTTIIFYNITGSTQAAVRIAWDVTNANGQRFLENITIKASSWDNVTGANGYGIEVTAIVRMKNVQIVGFEKYNLFLHNTVTDGQAPYDSVLESVFSTHAGEHGIVVGTGANTCTFINCSSKNSGCTAYLVAPVAAGNFDGFHMDYLNAGNPGSAFFSYVPEGIKILGGDCSANSRYGWNFLACQSGTLMPSYAEANFQAAPGQVNLTIGLTHCFIILDGIAGRTAGVNFGMIGSGTDLGSNRVFVGGRDCGSGESNTETLRTQMANARKISYFGHNNDFSNAALIFGETDGVANFGSVGTGYWNLNSTPLRYADVQVLAGRQTGWGAPTGTATRTTFNTATVLLAPLAERVKALIDDLTAHGLIGA